MTNLNDSMEELRELRKKAGKDMVFAVLLYTAAANNFYVDSGTRHDEDLPSYKHLVEFEKMLYETIDRELTKARLETAQDIRKIFDMSEWSIVGTMMDEHMMKRTDEEVAESKRFNRDHAWAAMSAQAKIDIFIEALTNQLKEKGE